MKKKKEIGRINAVDEASQTVVIVKIQTLSSFQSAQTVEWVKGAIEYVSEDGSPINKIDDATFENALTGKILKAL